jgi:AraC family transcriptional regulator
MVRTALRGTSYISVEQQWRRVDGAIGAVNEFGAHVLASRWKREEDTSLDVSSETGQDVHTLAIILTPTRMTFWHAGHTLFDGCAMPGITQVTAPRQYVCATFHSHCDVLHLHMSQPLLHECYQGTFGCEHQGDILIHRTEPVRDVTMERLGVALVHADDTRAAFGRLFFDSVGLAIVSRLLARELAEEALAPARPNATALQPWRVRRVIEYIDANLSDAIRLADLARVTGLSRMHFASQFRAATGFTPHEFLVRTRIERARRSCDTRIKARSTLHITRASSLNRTLRPSSSKWLEKHRVNGVGHWIAGPNPSDEFRRVFALGNRQGTRPSSPPHQPKSCRLTNLVLKR